MSADDLDLFGGGDVVTWPKVPRLAYEIGKAMQFGPRKLLREASAHGGSIAGAGEAGMLR